MAQKAVSFGQLVTLNRKAYLFLNRARQIQFRIRCNTESMNLRDASSRTGSGGEQLKKDPSCSSHYRTIFCYKRTSNEIALKMAFTSAAAFLFWTALLSSVANAQVGQVTGLNLVRAGSGQSGAVVASLTNGTVVTLDEAKLALSIVATTSNGTVSGVDFTLNGVFVRTDWVAAYAMCGNSANFFNVCDKIQKGKHTVTAKPRNGNPFTVTFEIVDTYGALQLSTRNVVQLGPRPYFLVKAMKESPLKTKLGTSSLAFSSIM